MEWTQEQQNEFTHLYQQLEHLPGYDKKKANNVLFKEMLPYDEAKKRIHSLTEQAKGHSLESKLHDTHAKHLHGNDAKSGFNLKPEYVGLAGLITSAALLSANLIGLGVAGLIATTAYVSSSYKKQEQHLHA